MMVEDTYLAFLTVESAFRSAAERIPLSRRKVVSVDK